MSSARQRRGGEAADHKRRVANTVFIDNSTPYGGGGEPWVPECRSCRQIIAQGQKQAQVRFERHEDTRLQALNGTYHEACAKPILSVKRAYDAMRRFGGG